MKVLEVAQLLWEVRVDVVIVQIERFQEWKALDVLRKFSTDADAAQVQVFNETCAVACNTLPLAHRSVSIPAS